MQVLYQLSYGPIATWKLRATDVVSELTPLRPQT